MSNVKNLLGSPTTASENHPYIEQSKPNSDQSRDFIPIPPALKDVINPTIEHNRFYNWESDYVTVSSQSLEVICQMDVNEPYFLGGVADTMRIYIRRHADMLSCGVDLNSRGIMIAN